MKSEQQLKSHPITREKVWEAFKQVRRKGGVAGVDGITIEQVAANPEKHLYLVWNRYRKENTTGRSDQSHAGQYLPACSV